MRFEPITIDDAQATQIGQAGGVVLMPPHRAKLCHLLASLAVARWQETVGKTTPGFETNRARAKHLGGLLTSLGHFKANVSEPQPDCDDDALFEIIGVEPVRLLGELVAWKNLTDVLAGLKKGRPLEAFLLEMEALYREAGGGTTGVWKKSEIRESQFIRFVHAAVGMIPGGMPIGGFGALASRWERIYRARKRASHVEEFSVRYFSLMKSLTKLGQNPAHRREDNGRERLEVDWFEEIRAMPAGTSWWEIFAANPAVQGIA